MGLPDTVTQLLFHSNKLETWNETGGHRPIPCKKAFFLAQCAVNCYTQWFSGLSCPSWNIPIIQQYKVARSRVLRYNFIMVIEKLRDPNYVLALERFFGVIGLSQIKHPYCEKESHQANEKNPLVIRNDTRERLTKLNELDIKLYRELSWCLNNGKYNFPKWDPTRFALNSYNHTAAKVLEKESKTKKKTLSNTKF